MVDIGGSVVNVNVFSLVEVVHLDSCYLYSTALETWLILLLHLHVYDNGGYSSWLVYWQTLVTIELLLMSCYWWVFSSGYRQDIESSNVDGNWYIWGWPSPMGGWVCQSVEVWGRFKFYVLVWLLHFTFPVMFEGLSNPGKRPTNRLVSGWNLVVLIHCSWIKEKRGMWLTRLAGMQGSSVGGASC